MTPEERNVLIKQYAEGYDEVIRALDNFPGPVRDRDRFVLAVLLPSLGDRSRIGRGVS